ncbi:MAG: GWxTD domain-containing protein [Haliscomenobacteraceae bacterium CHB4]|nr:GWxTD domain-containing protein [Haliscomenobacteraceae bacterium CHB4]
MKTKHLFFALGLLMPWTGRALDAGVSYAVYATPEKPYLEINIEIAAASVTFKRADSTHLQASVETLILIKQGETIVNYEKYLLNSPLVESPRALLDVKRMSLSNGDYTLEITFQDVHDPENRDVFKTPLKVDVGNTIYLSEVQLLRSFRPDNSDNPFTKNGYFLEPLPFNFYDKGAALLAFYSEIYYSDKVVTDATYLVRYFIEQEKGNGVKNLISIGNQRKKPSSIDAVLVQMDINKLESGNYTLTVEIRNAANELLTSRSLAFQRSNPFLNVPENELTDEMVSQQFVQNFGEDTLRYSLRAISALAVGVETDMLKNILQNGDQKAMRFYLFRHFMREDPNNPELAYKKFMEVAAAADTRFRSGFRYGFETDRGRAYLRFGRPDDLIHVEDDPGAPPYEIWVYYKFPKTQQNNVKFLFYNPSLAGEDFILLHSTARGEISNPRWERVLYSRNPTEYVDGDNYHDATGTQRNLGRNARAYFEDF